jgi:hypothetical protein
MKDKCTYFLRLRGQMNEGEINTISPIQMTVMQMDAEGTLLTFCSDQAGLVGLLSFLHGMGFMFLSIYRVELADQEYDGPEPDGQ